MILLRVTGRAFARYLAHPPAIRLGSPRRLPLTRLPRLSFCLHVISPAVIVRVSAPALPKRNSEFARCGLYRTCSLDESALPCRGSSRLFRVGWPAVDRLAHEER